MGRVPNNLLCNSWPKRKRVDDSFAQDQDIGELLSNFNLQETKPISSPQKNEVLIGMQSVGICGSDVHYLKAMKIGDFIVKQPMVLGHESSGIILEVGEGVTHLNKGDRVAIEPGVPCRYCSFCKEGRYNLCKDMVFCATPPYDGSLCHYYTHQADFCYKLPDHVSFDEGAFLEPLSVVVHACQRAGIGMGDHVLICGAGPIGLACLLVAKASGATQVAVTDIDQGRLDVAKQIGADVVHKVESRDGKVVGKQIIELFGMADRTVECTGVESSIHTAIHATVSGGVVVIVGMGKPEIQFPVFDALAREIDIRGIFRYVNCYPIALELIASGKVNVKPLITHHFKLKDTLEAFKTASLGQDGAIKVIIQCGKE